MPPPYAVDLRQMAEKAPVVFRGQVASVTKGREKSSDQPYSLANFRIDRVYRGELDGQASIAFRYPSFLNGHDCIDFQPDSYWLVFASGPGGRLKMTDDCVGAMTVAPQLGRKAGDEGWPAQIELDFLAGLESGDPAERVVSLQRLAGWHSASTREELHRAIEHGSEEESKWAVYAALRTGDMSVLPRIREILSRAKERAEPETDIALELKNVREAVAVPDLIAILNSSRIELTRSCVLVALAENIKDSRAVPTFAANLNEKEARVRWLALLGMQKMSGSWSCSLPEEGSNDESALRRQVAECEGWWEQEGRFQNWDAR
jgi:hypothetical protein